jgi:Mrp family chromosome partitioning ATPase
MSVEQALTLGIAVVTFLVGGIDFLVRWWLHKPRDEAIKELNEKLTASRIDAAHLRTALEKAEAREGVATVERDQAQADGAKEKKRADDLATVGEAQAAELTELRGVRDLLKKGQKAHDNRIRRALQLEGAIRTQPVMAGTPRFRPLAERRTPIISVLNLKGGVGKTTLTAHLGWAFARLGYRVLLEPVMHLSAVVLIS